MAPPATMTTPITSAFAGSLAIIYSGLQLRVGLYRKSSKIGFGVENKGVVDEHLQRIQRAGQNFSEYAPVGVFLLFLLESQRLMPEWALCSFGTLLGLSRIGHAVVLTKPDIPHALNIRALCFLTTLGTLVGGGAYLWYKAYWH